MTSQGQKLSITSRSGIRYEGILSKIDPQDNTVSLINVRMFGTENRPAPEFVPLKHEVYDYIVFKGSDIKDLTVFDNKSAPPQDPAIVSAGKAVPQPKASSNNGGMNVRNVLGGAGGLGGFGGSKAPQSSYQPAAASDYEQYSKTVTGYSAGGGSRYMNSAPPVAYIGGKGYKAQRETRERDSSQYNTSYGGYGGGPSKGSASRDYSSSAPAKGGKSGGYSTYTTGYHAKGGKGSKDSKGGKGFKGSKGGKKGNAYATHTGMEFAPLADKAGSTFKEDFDFEGMRKKMKAEEKQESKAGGESHYKKDSSFFDTITYDVNNREKTEKVEKQAQHETDCQTFGAQAVEDYERKNLSHGFKGKGKGKGKGGKGGKGSKGGKSYKGKNAY